MIEDVTCIILSGGDSSRMGVNKSLLKYGNSTVIGTISGLMQSLFENVFLITNSASDYSFLNLNMYKDVYKSKGPLSGIHSGLKHSFTERNFIVSCDMPFLTKETIFEMIYHNSSKPITVFSVNSYIHPLPGIYSKSVFPLIENKLVHHDSENRKNFKMLNFLQKKYTEIIHTTDRIDFFNLNTPSDYEFLKNH